MSSKKGKSRRRVFRAGAGSAFLRFLVGVILLVAICGTFYVFVLQGEVDLSGAIARLRGETPAPDETDVSATPSPVPTIEPTRGAIATPVPAASATPIPYAEIAQPVQLQGELAMPDDTLEKGLREMTLFEEGGTRALVIRGYAFVPGRNAAESQGYILLFNAENGGLYAAYQTQASPQEAYLTFEGDAGSNLEQAFFRVNLDVSGMPDGKYLVAAAVENGDHLYWQYYDDSVYYFTVTGGSVVIMG